MNHVFMIPIGIPILLGFVCFVLPQRLKRLREILALIGSFGIFVVSILLFTKMPLEWTSGDQILFQLDSLAGFVLLASTLFGFLITLYSIKYMEGLPHHRTYYGFLLMTIGAACGAMLANHLMLLLLFWGFLGITLYLLVLTGGEGSAHAARKSLVIIGGSDALMLFGILLIYALTKTYQMNQIQLSFDSIPVYIIFLCLASGAFAKAGAMPLHTWIPDVAESAPIPVTAYLPAALDKLLGIYLLGRMGLSLFKMSSAANLILLIVGSITILAAVLMALIQHDFRRLLAYHAVSQVGYMVLGIGTGNPIGIAGGLFHMLNHSIYKACLFLTGGAVKHRTRTADLDELGGIGKFMPITFISFLIAAFAISGIPPLNGFVSKWMVYQGLVEMGQNGDKLWIIWLVAALFGSGLTLASFMKLTHAIFLGVPHPKLNLKDLKEVGFGMAFPMIVLALLCILFGVFAYSLPLKMFILPAVPPVSYLGFWAPQFATLMILLGILIGIVIYLAGNVRWKGVREAKSFIGGEKLPEQSRVTGTGFYYTIQNMGGFRKIFHRAEGKSFDIYHVTGDIASGIVKVFQKAHTGILTMYVIWFIVGLGVLFLLVLK